MKRLRLERTGSKTTGQSPPSVIRGARDRQNDERPVPRDLEDLARKRPRFSRSVRGGQCFRANVEKRGQQSSESNPC